MAYKYKAFISYSHKDKAWAEWLMRALEAYRIPRRLVGRTTDKGAVPGSLAPIFRDRDELPATDRMSERLFTALADSEFLIVICSPSAATSKLVNQEIAEFKRVHGGGNILSLITGGTPFASTPTDECFPEALQHRFHEDGARAGLAAEGLAADAREDGDGKQMALAKLVAGLIGVGLNEIVRRQTQRRNRRIAAAAAAAAASLMVMGYLTFEATTARREAVELARIAQAKTLEAEKHLADNEKLALYVMTSVYEELLKAGNLDALERLSNQMLDYFASIDDDNLSATQMFNFTGNLIRLALTYDRRGESERARAIFESMLVMSRQLRADMPESSRALNRLQNNLFFVGDLAERQGRVEDAEGAFRERLELLSNIGDLAVPFDRPDWPTTWRTEPGAFWREKKADAESVMARLLANTLGRPAEAIDHGMVGLLPREQMGAIRQDNQPAIYSLATAYQYLGDAYRSAGRLEEAFATYEKQLALLTALLEFEPGNFQSLHWALGAKLKVAQLHQMRGNLTDAQMLFRSIATDFDRLTEQEPGDTNWLAEAASSYAGLAELSLQLGDRAAAASALARATAQIDEALTRDNTGVADRLTKYRTKLTQARLALAETEHAVAERLTSQLEAAIAAEDSNYFWAAGAREHQSETALLMGDLKTHRGDPAGAEAAYKRAVTAINALPGTLNLTAQHHLMHAYDRLGRAEEATALRAALDAAGFAPDRHPRTLGQLRK